MSKWKRKVKSDKSIKVYSSNQSVICRFPANPLDWHMVEAKKIYVLSDVIEMPNSSNGSQQVSTVVFVICPVHNELVLVPAQGEAPTQGPHGEKL